MRCDDVQLRISACIDEGQALDEPLRRHVAQCPVCAAFERDCGRLDELLAAGAPMAASAVEPRTRAIRLRWPIAISTLAAAAMVALAIFPPHRWWSSPPAHPPVTVNAAFPRLNADVGRMASRAALSAEAIAFEPYRQEIALLSAEARLATATLISFLPTNPILREPAEQ